MFLYRLWQNYHEPTDNFFLKYTKCAEFLMKFWDFYGGLPSNSAVRIHMKVCLFFAHLSPLRIHIHAIIWQEHSFDSKIIQTPPIHWPYFNFSTLARIKSPRKLFIEKRFKHGKKFFLFLKGFCNESEHAVNFTLFIGK